MPQSKKLASNRIDYMLDTIEEVAGRYPHLSYYDIVKQIGWSLSSLNRCLKSRGRTLPEREEPTVGIKDMVYEAWLLEFDHRLREYQYLLSDLKAAKYLPLPSKYLTTVVTQGDSNDQEI